MDGERSKESQGRAGTDFTSANYSVPKDACRVQAIPEHGSAEEEKEEEEEEEEEKEER